MKCGHGWGVPAPDQSVNNEIFDDHTQQQFGVSGLRNNNLEGKVEEVESHECLQRMFDKTTVAKRAEPFYSVLLDLEGRESVIVFG